MELLIIYAVLAIGVSFLCSMLEASLLSMSNSYVQTLVDRGSRVGRELQGMKANIDRPLSAILTMNTIAHTVGAAGVGAQAANVWGNKAVAIASAVMTLLILVVSEIIPKTLGAVHATRLAGMTAMTTRGMIYLCYPLIVTLETANRLIGYKRHEQRLSRAELIATIRLGEKGGILREREYRIVSNLLALEQTKLLDVRTPRTVVFALPELTTVQEVLAEHPQLRFARIPVYGESVDEVTGYVARFDIYDHYAKGLADVSLKDLKKPLPAMPEIVSVANGLEHMLQNRLHIMLVVDEYGGTEGIVTLEDLLETLLGEEIVDETDPAVDMQAVAKAKRDGETDTGES